MKRMTLIVALSLGITAGYAQKVKEAEVPVAVKDAFAKKYPGLKAEWEKEDGNYEAEFDGKKVRANMETGKSTKVEVEGSVLISPDGNILETEEEIETKALPAGVSDYVAKNLGGKKIAEAFKITNASGAVSYEIEIGKDEYLFDNNGGFVKKIEKKDDKDDDDKKDKKK
jgi:hypothetical protein